MNELITSNKKIYLLIIITASTIITITYYALFINNIDNIPSKSLQINSTNYNDDDDMIDFEGFDNIKGLDHNIVPNIVHLLYLQETKIKFFQIINIFSIYLNHKPNFIYIHCDKCDFEGKYYKKLKSFKELWNIVRIKKIPYKETIFGVRYGWINHHRSDIWRLMLLMNYGGIFLDNDVYVVNSLNEYLKYEMTVSWDSENDGLGVQVLIAHRNARLLKAHFDSYRYNYTPSAWYWNAGHMPAKILIKHKYLAHAVKFKLGTHMLVHNLYKIYWREWKTLDSIHLLINHRHYLDKESPIKDFDENNIQTYNYTYGYMVRDILSRANNLF